MHYSELQNSARFRLIERLEFDHVLPFVREYYLQRRNWVVIIHYLLCLANLVAILWLSWRLGLNFNEWMVHVGLVVLVMLPLIPLHELLHALVYTWIGARDVRFGLLWRQGAAYAVAHQFVTSAHQFVWVALAPFLAINGVCLLIALFIPQMRLFALLLSLVHLSAVSGDWAMLSFLWEHHAAPVFTYDNADQKVTFFYQSL